jgi:hypothetical protein
VCTVRDTFLRNGVVGRDLLAVDWESTALGPLELWPQSLQTVVRMVLGSRFSMWMAWGPELTFFCNDAYRRHTLGAKYPWALGKPASVVWSEVWSDVESRIDQVLSTGVATWDERLLLFLERNGYREESYHTFSYSPLYDDAGAIAGLLCVVSEDTDEVIAHRRLSTLRELGDRATVPLEEAAAVASFSEGLDLEWPDLPFHLVYLYDGDGVRLADRGGFGDDHPAAPDTIAPSDALWPEPATDDTPTLVKDLGDRFADLPTGVWSSPPEQAVVVPIPRPHAGRVGYLVVGLNPFRPYDQPYADFLGLVAARLGATIAGARAINEVTAREHQIADELQASLLPRDTFDLEDLEVATYYRAGVAGTQVGGDWYDVIRLADGRTALVIGDVMGRGVRAASVMGQLRTAIRAYARIGLSPDELMTSLDDLVRDLFPEQVVTCIYGVFDPADSALRFVNAGHLPPLVTHPDGSCTRVDVDTHPPLGVAPPFDQVHRIDLEPGAGVVLYTDGLVEHRGQDLEAGIATLCRAATRLDVPLDAVPKLLVRACLTDGPSDDVAVLVARVSGPQLTR